MVVGQYYMEQINAELGKISDGISKISDFQDKNKHLQHYNMVMDKRKVFYMTKIKWSAFCNALRKSLK